MNGTTFTPLEEHDASSSCGDGDVTGAEVCDGDDLAGEDCTTQGPFSGGTLTCTEGCAAFDVAGCDSAPSVPVLRLPLNNAYAGRAGVSDTLRPRFVWEPSDYGGAATVTYELEYSTDAGFEVGLVTVPTVSTSHQPGSALLVSMTHPVGARYYWRVRACASGECSAPSEPRWINLGRSEHDLNGDGFADLAVGAPRADGAAGADAGSVFVYFGGATLDDQSDGTLTGTHAGEEFGARVSMAGDVNGDGFGDLLVGAFLNDAVAMNAGRVYVYLGGPGTVFDTQPDGVLSGGAAGDKFGGAVDGAGDVNADGFADVIVGAMGQGGSLLGTAYVFFGADGGTFDAVPDGVLHRDGEYLGASVAGAGDTNGDGIDDVIVGGFCDPDLCAHVYLGTRGAFEAMPDATVLSDTTGTNDAFGVALGGLGDVNGDGFGDLAVGANLSIVGGVEAAGRAYVYFGGESSLDPVPDGIVAGTSAGEWLGEALAPAGDVNGDGLADLIVGAQGNSVAGATAGAAFILLGQSGTSFDSTADGVLTGDPGDSLGTSVSTVGDVNGDGYDDVLVGAYQNSSSGSQSGAAVLYLGGAGVAFEATADVVLLGAEAGGQFGVAVARPAPPSLPVRPAVEAR